MAQSHGAGLQLPPPRSAGLEAGLEELGKCEALLRELPGVMKPSGPAEELVGRALEALTRGLGLLHAAAAAGGNVAAPKAEVDQGDSFLLAQLPPTATSPRYSEATKERSGMFSHRRRAGGLGVTEKKARHRRRSHVDSCREHTSTTLDDGYTWRKYGQKDIENSSEPRSYYRCSYKKSRGCEAQRQAQKLEDGSGLYHITYLGNHICNLPAAAHHHRNNQRGQQKLTLGSHLISFAAEGAGAAASTLRASFPAPCKQEPAAVTVDPVKTSSDTKPGLAAESASLPVLSTGCYCGGQDQQGGASPGQSSAASGVSHEDIEYMDDLDLTSLITLGNPDDFSTYFF